MEKLTKSLRSKTPTSRRAAVENIPGTSVRSRTFQRCLAHHLVLDLPSEEAYKAALTDYSALADALVSQDAATNPILVREGRDYKQVEANLHLVVYSLNDLAFQLLLEAKLSDKCTAAKKGSLKRTIDNYLNVEGARDFHKDIARAMVNHTQLDSLYRIMESLHLRGNQIQDGKGAFLDRSKVKDQLQRLRLMILYQLGSYGLAGAKATSKLQQGTLANWFTNQ
ncbi:hypothetical protein CBS101457_002330 [Exobasidium rhododendri]|nr:hypothetical protein CBS101457_002330 [Exobasidium rhododendri]